MVITQLFYRLHGKKEGIMNLFGIENRPTIFAYNNAVAFNGDNVYSNEPGALAYQCKNYGNANVYKLDVETIGWKNRKEN